MTHLLTARTRRLALAAGLAGTAALGAATVAPAAQAAPFSCSATALDASVGLPPGSATKLPTDAASIADGPCTTREGGIPSIPANPLLSGGALNANSQVTGTGPAQSATAQGRIAELDVGSLTSLPGLPLGQVLAAAQAQVPSQLDQDQTLTAPQQVKDGANAVIAVLTRIAALPVPVPVPTGLPAPLDQLSPARAQEVLTQLQAALDQSVTINPADLIRAALQLPDFAVLNTGVASATATARCVDNKAVLDGSSQVASIRALGQDLPTDDLANQVLTIDTQKVDLADVALPGVARPAILDQLGLGGVADQLLQSLQSQIVAQVQAGLAQLPGGGIAIPASALNLTVTPRSQDRTGTTLTQRGPRLTLNVGGQPVLDLTLGRASVSGADADCAPAAVVQPPAQTPPVQGGAANSGSTPGAGTAPSAAQQLLQCSERRLVLTNVLQRSNRVALFGVADKAFAGQTVTLRFRATGKDVATATVAPDGTFQTTAPLPSRKVRGTNQARYQARIGSNTSLDLKLQRRMTVSSLDQAAGTVTVKGKLVQPLPTGGASVLISRRVSCNKYEAIKRVKAAKDGSYEVSVPASAAGSGVVYRLQSKVRNNPRNPKTFRTYTLPQGIDINA